MTALTPQAPTFRRRAVRYLRYLGNPARAVLGRLRYLSPFPRRFTGAYASFDEAMRLQPQGTLVGYDHEQITHVAFARMCEVAPWDYPVLFWLDRLMGETATVVDCGGHMGTKYRAFRNLLCLDGRGEWIVQDLPAIVAAGRAQAKLEGLGSLSFVEKLEEVESADILLASGLLQYLDEPFVDYIDRLEIRPRHIVLNKVALRDGPTVVTLERIGAALVPYQIRNRQGFLGELDQLGYDALDSWTIPSLSHVIDTHPELGASESVGFTLCLRD